MARNSLEEQLEAVRNQRDFLKTKLKEETDRKKMQKLIDIINQCNQEEKELLKQLGYNYAD